MTTDREVLASLDTDLITLINLAGAMRSKISVQLAAPAPAPAPSPSPTPPPVVPKGLIEHPPGTFPATPGSTQPFEVHVGEMHSWPLPKDHGQISLVEWPGNPALDVELTISPTPGDSNYCNSDAAMIQPSRGPKKVVCGVKGNSWSMGITWNQPDGCVVPAGAKWFVNMKVIAGADPSQPVKVGVGLSL